MLNILYNLRNPVPKEYKNIQKKYNNLALKKFDMISTVKKAVEASGTYKKT